MPDTEYFQLQFSVLKSKLLEKITVSEFEQALSQVQSVSGGTFTDITITIMGTTATIVSAEYVNAVLSTVHSWVRGFFFVLLVLYNYNQVHRLIRGSDIVVAGRAAGVETKVH